MSGQVLAVHMDKEHEKVDFIPSREEQLMATKGQMLSRRHELLMALVARGWLNHRLAYIYAAVDGIYLTTRPSLTTGRFREKLDKRVGRLLENYIITVRDGVPKAPELVDRWVEFLQVVNIADLQGLGGAKRITYRDLSNALNNPFQSEFSD